MDTSDQVIWHYESLPKHTKKAFDFLSKESWLKKSDWYLAGGTALALQGGNRKSFDLDFFTKRKNIKNEELLEKFHNTKQWKVTMDRKNTIYGELFNAKISFIAYPYFIPEQKMLLHGSISVLNKIDIAVMKITAISQRGRKRDFFDLYWCAQNVEPLEKTILRLKKQYPTTVHNYQHIIKALLYFEDAESDPEPDIYFDADWKKVKRFFTKEIPVIAQKLIR